MTVTDTTILEAVLRRDRMILVAALVGVIAIAWIWIVIGAGTGMSTVGMTRRSGMPGAAPILMLFARVNRAEKARNRPFIGTGIFAAGYLAAWGGFSMLAIGL